MDEEEKRIKLEEGRKIFEKKRNKMKRLQIDGIPESQRGGNDRVMKDSFSENVPPNSLESGSMRVEGSNLSDTSQSSTASEKLRMDQALSPRQNETSIRESMHEHQRKLQTYKGALDERDKLIEEMKQSLEEALRARNRDQEDAESLTGQATKLRQEMQQALLEQKQHIGTLHQTVEAQEQEISMLRQIRDDLLSRISTEPIQDYRDVAVGTTPDGKFQVPAEEQSTCHDNQSSTWAAEREDLLKAIELLKHDLQMLHLDQSPVPNIDEQYSSTDVPNLKDNRTVDADKLAFCKQTVCFELADWISTRALCVEDIRDVVPILCDLKSFAFQGLQYPVVCEHLNQTKQQLEVLRHDTDDLREKTWKLQAELDASQEEVRRLRYANNSLRRGSEKLDEEVKTLKREKSIMKNLNDSLTSIKEKAKLEAEEETTLEVYSLQTECIRLELEKKELEQKTRLLSAGEHSPCMSPVPRPLSPERTYGHSFTQTEMANDSRETSQDTQLHSQLACLKSEKSSLQLIVQQLRAELKQANRCADELRREKGSMDSVIAEKNKVLLEKEELMLELEALHERLQMSEAKVKNLQEGLQKEHLSLQKFVSETEQATKDVLRGGRDVDAVNIFLEKQRLMCEVKLLNEKLQAERDLNAQLQCQVSHMSKREDFHKKCIKDLCNRLLCAGNEARGLLMRCSKAERRLEGTLVKVKHLSSEVHRLRQRLSDVEDLQEDEVSHFHEDFTAHSTDIYEEDDSNISCGVDDGKVVLDNASAIDSRQAKLDGRLEEQEVLFKCQELGMQVSQELHLCQLRDEMHKNYCNKLSDMMESVAARCQQDLLTFEQRLTAETSLQILALEEKHETDVISLKSYHRDQIDKFLSKLQSQPELPVGRPEKEGVLAELRAKQQLEYEQLLSCLDSEQKLRLQALVALTLKVHHVENELSLLHTQARMNREKERILELFATANQADKDVLVAQLEYEKTSALKRLHEAFLERERELKNVSIPHTPHSVLSDSGSMSWSTGSTNVEGLVQMLKDQLDKEFYACIDKLSGKWKEKYSCIINQSALEESLGQLDLRGEARDIAVNLTKCLTEADEAEQLINTFFHLSHSLKEDFNSKLEQLLCLHQEWSAESKRAAGAETTAAEQSLELEALRTKLEEEYSRQKTQLCAEQVSKTKELLNKHKKELEDIQKFAEETVAEERRRWLEKLDVLRNSFQQKEQENLRQSQEREAKISEEMTELVAKYDKILEELRSEKDKVEDLQTALGNITSEHNVVIDKVKELVRDPTRPEHSEETVAAAVDWLLEIHSRLLEQNKALSAMFENIKTKLSDDSHILETGHYNVVTVVENILSENARLKEDLALMGAEYQTKAEVIEAKFEQVETLRKQKIQELVEAQETLVASLTEKEEQMQMLKNELNLYVGSVDSLNAEHAAELERMKADLGSHHEKQVDLLKREHASLMQSAKEEYAASMEKLEKKLEKLIAEHAVEKERLSANLAASNDDVARKDKELNELESCCAALQCMVEELKAEKEQLKARDYAEVPGSLLQRERQGAGEDETPATVPAKIEEKEESMRVPSLRIQEPSPEWSDVSVEDVLCERMELQRQVKCLGETVCRLETEKEELQEQLQKTDEQQTKEPRLRARSPREWLAGSGLTANEIQSWQLHTAQTNTRLLNVLSDLVKTYVDTEQDIQDTLANIGLSQHPTLDPTAAHEDDYPSLGAISQTHGSKEDFASGIADGFLSELCEDGPDLTPRTWDMFASAIGVQEMESEGEDVVLGASRRLRAAVDRVLRLLTDVAEHRGEDFRGLVQRNQDLCQELQEESNVHNQLCLELLNAQASLRTLEQEKRKLENKLGVVEDDYTKLNRELRLVKAKAQRLEDAQESVTEERRLIEEQRRLLANSLQEPQLTPCTLTDEETSDNKTDNPPEELLEENTKLNEEKKRLRKSQDEEKQALQLRIVELEGVLEEASAQRELLFEERQREIADLLAQIEGMDKQLQSNKKFIEEQTHEREQEREEFAQEISRLQETIKEKEKIQNCEARLTKEIETLEQQLRFKVEENALACKKREHLEAEVRNRDDKIHDLREIIRQLEADLAQKSRCEYELLQKLANMEDALNVEESAHTKAACELEKMRRSSVQSDTSEHVKQLEEQLESRNQELDKMTQFQSLLQEFLAQVRALEEKVESRIQQQQNKSGSFRKFLEVLSPEGSRDGATSGQSGTSEETENRRVLSLDDIRDLSPSALQWDELRRLEEKVDILLTASTEAFKANSHLQKQVKQLERAKGELEQEKFAMQEEGQRQLLQISALKARMEDCRAGLGVAGGSPVSQQLHRLKEELLRQREAREDAEHKLQLSREQFSSLQAKVNVHPHTVGGARGKRGGPSACLFGATVVPLKDPLVDVAIETELSMERIGELEKTLEELRKELDEYRMKCTIQENEMKSLNTYQDKTPVARAKDAVAGRRKLEKDFEEVQEMLEEREDELSAFQRRGDGQVVLETTVGKLQAELAELHREHARIIEEKAHDSKEQQESLESQVRMLHQIVEQQADKHSQAQEALRAKIATLEEQLNDCVPKEQADSAINRAVARERDMLKLKHEEELKQQEETWKCLLESERQKLEAVCLRAQEDMQQKCLSRDRTRAELEAEVQALFEQERAALKAQHTNELDAAQMVHEEEIKALRSAHAEEIHCALEELRASLQQIHTEGMEEQKRQLLAAAEHEKQTLLTRHVEDMKCRQQTWEQHMQQTQTTQHKGWAHGSPKQLQAYVRQHVEQEVKRLQVAQDREVDGLKTKLKECEDSHQNDLLKLKQHHSAEVAKARHDAAVALKEERHWMNVRAAEQAAAADDRLGREKAALVEKMDLEKQRLQLDHEQEKTKLIDSHTEQVAAMRAAHRREMDVLRTQLQKLQIKAFTRNALLGDRSHESTPVSDDTSSSELTSSFDDCSQDSVLSPSLRRLLGKIYKDGLQMLSYTERQLLQHHLAPVPGRFDPEGSNEKDFQPDGSSLQRGQSLQEPGELNASLRKRASEGALVEEVLSLKEQLSRSEWQSKSKFNRLEFQLKQERIKADELKKALEEEVAKNIELLSQLNGQRSNCLELEMTLASCKADFEEARSKADYAKKEALYFRNLYETERTRARNMLNAYEAERTHFNQLRASLQTERKRGASTHERDQQTIRELKNMSQNPCLTSQHTTPCTASRDVEKMRDADLASLLVGLESSLPTVAADDEESYKFLHKWHQEKVGLNQSIRKLEEEKARLQALLSNMEHDKSSFIPPATINLLYKVYWKYRRTESWRKALAYQKEYLLSLLRGYQATEETTLKMLGYGRPTSLFERSKRRSPLFRFRSAVRVVLAVQRMHHLVSKWKTAAIIPSLPQVLHKAEQVVIGVPVVTASAMGSPGAETRLHTLAGSSTSSNGTSGPLRKQTTPSRSSGSQVSENEYVRRLEALHKMFGIDVP